MSMTFLGVACMRTRTAWTARVSVADEAFVLAGPEVVVILLKCCVFVFLFLFFFFFFVVAAADLAYRNADFEDKGRVGLDYKSQGWTSLFAMDRGAATGRAFSRERLWMVAAFLSWCDAMARESRRGRNYMHGVRVLGYDNTCMICRNEPKFATAPSAGLRG